MVKKKEDNTSNKKTKKENNVKTADKKTAVKQSANQKAKIEDIEKIIKDDIKNVNELPPMEDNAQECCTMHSHKCKTCFAFIVIGLVAACAIAEYVFDNKRYSALSESNTTTVNKVQESTNKIDELAKKVSSLANAVESLEKNASGIYSETNNPREKWKIWVALKNKLENGESFDKELKIFYDIFAYDTELVGIVKNIVSELGTVAEKQTEDNAVMEAVKKYVNKVVKIGKIDHRKLLEISGYVITSIKTGSK